MAIFNSLGSNYNSSYVLKSLITRGSLEDKKLLKEYLAQKYGGQTILLYKGREALTLALNSLKLPEDSEVAINGFTCVAVYNAIQTAGLTPICLDLEKSKDINFSYQTLETKLKENKNIRSVVIQNTLGFPCDISRIEKICKEHKLILIEDLAHCVGTKYQDGREAGTVGDLVILSFSQDKIIDAVSGGALVIRNEKIKGEDIKMKTPKNSWRDKLYPEITYKIRKWYDFGIGKPYHFLVKRFNLLSKPTREDVYDLYSLPSWHANMALYQFKNLDNQLSHRLKIASVYAQNLDKKLLIEEVVDTFKLSANLRFPIVTSERNQLIKHLRKHKIFISDTWYVDVAPECPNAVALSKIVVNLPTHINISESQALTICQIINTWIK